MIIRTTGDNVAFSPALIVEEQQIHDTIEMVRTSLEVSMKSAFDNMNDNKLKFNWIDGEISKSSSDRYEIVTDSTTGEQCASVIMSTEQDVEAAIHSSREALKTWS